MSAAVVPPPLTPPATTKPQADPLSRRRSPAGAPRVRLEHLPELLVLLSLCGLVTITVWQLRSVRALLKEITQTIEPATRAAADLQLALAKEAASTRAFLLTGNPAYATEFHVARAARRRTIAQLTALPSSAGSGVNDLVSDANRQLVVADRRLDGLFAGTIPPAAYLHEFPDQHQRFNLTIASAATLHERLRAQATAYRARVDATEQVGVVLELGVVILAFVAGVAIVRSKDRERAARMAIGRAHADAELRRAQLESMTTRWTRLIRGFSHDLKNPLNAAQGHLFMLETGVKGALSPSQVHAVSKCRHNVDTALALTADLVDLARAETAEVDVRRVEVNLCDLVTSVVDDYRAQAVTKGLAILLDVPPAPEKVESNPARVSQILGNLVSNAIKYTSAGTITIGVRRRTDSAGHRGVAVDVSDTGPGIPKEHQRRIFHEFERLESAKPAGIGIGLAISERLAHTLGGTVTLDSEPGKGSTFTLWLPLAGAGDHDRCVPIDTGQERASPLPQTSNVARDAAHASQ